MTINKNFIFCAMKNIHCRKSSTLKCTVVQIKKTTQNCITPFISQISQILENKNNFFLKYSENLEKAPCKCPQ